jgi:predicted MPP superfamily phosphohydrolase
MKFDGIFVTQFIVKFIYIFFELAHDIKGLVMKFRPKKKFRQPLPPADESSTRRDFIRKAGIVIAAVPFMGAIHGIGWGRFRFTVRHSSITFKDLPASFDGLRIVQLSDAHLGGFYGHREKLEEVVDIIRDIKPDLLVFTGDMVNNFATEMDGWVDLWSRMEGRLGKFSILGNHDYGDYSEWTDPELKKQNLTSIIRHQQAMGFQVLMNQHVPIEKNGETLYLAGVENWGLPPFKQYGSLPKAMETIPEGAFTILLSHNPDHWTNGVLDDQRIKLMLAGHTHGFQIGIEIGQFKLSPSQLIYKHWAGMYKNGDQYLYVNRGLGYLAFPGRVGIWPEITLIELHRG